MDTEKNWDKAIAVSLAVIAMRVTETHNKTTSEKAAFLEALGVPRATVAELLGSTAASIAELLRQARAKKNGGRRAKTKKTNS